MTREFASAPPRLTRLELHGFKSFANRTVFLFEPGITAVIGPNGSGKSNISDAVRWVLGEQSQSALRGKKTEDVIFAGGNGKAPSGMAEVTVTFDNATGWLPIDFSEVTVTRRAFRSGDNQYLINGRKVRLKDVAHLTAGLGHSHVVVGQGMVDAALSQRAEDRRGLFEHAADLTGLRLKAAEAARGLAEAEANAARVADLLTELEPRLKTLERAARQAREWQGVHDRLRAVEQFHYARLLANVIARLDAAEAAAGSEDAVLATSRAEVERLSADLTIARNELAEARESLARHDARAQAATEQARRATHERELAMERQSALTKRREDMLDTRASLDEQAAGVQAQLADVAAELAAAEQAVTSARQQVAQLQSQTAAARKARDEAQQQAARLVRQIGDHDRNLAELARRRALIEQRRQTDAEERERIAVAGRERAARIERLQAEQTALDEADVADANRLESLKTSLAEQEKAIEAAAQVERAAREAVASIERALGQASARLDALRRIHESGAGLFNGVKETLRAAKAGKLTGVRGTIAELIEVPAEYETAIEVALGGHLQDLIVARWSDAEQAIAHLKRANAGRATFQPLDTVRANRQSAPNAHGPGVRGVAVDLIGFSVEIEAVVTALLGRILIVDDLPAARAALGRLPGGWSVVTIGGEIARSGGSVTGGAAVRESGVLGRERDLRELPKEIARLEAERDAAQATQRQAAAEPRRLTEQRRELENERTGLLAARKSRQEQRARLAAWIRDVAAEQAASEKRLTALDQIGAGAGNDLTALDAAVEAAQAERAKAAAAHEAIHAAIQRDAESLQAVDHELSREQRDLAASEERLRAERRREASLLAQSKALADELATRGERAAALDGELVALAAQRARLDEETTRLNAAREMVLTERPPLEAAVKTGEKNVARLEKELDASRAAAMEAERRHGQAGLNLERIRGEAAGIRQRIADDLELTEPDRLLELDLAAPEGVEEPAAAEREIAKLKDRLRRVGYAGEDVVAEHERESERHAFLRSQLDDVQGAAASLRKLLDDLHETMRARFEETFSKVSVVFTEMFTALFGGGVARLVLSAGEEGEIGGIDIVAQPPGKRLQSLALLSGGERALTAVALLFAILKVNPTPFCLLDEVDAALDEANVERFRERLQELAAETQAIVITHNRGTVEAADSLYGVSMRDDGVSQVLSLRISDAALATK
jgi:chromosome segregation protein